MILALGLLITFSGLATMSRADDTQEKERLIQLLEFIGDWETQDGEWIDPESAVLLESNNSLDDKNKPVYGGQQ